MVTSTQPDPVPVTAPAAASSRHSSSFTLDAATITSVPAVRDSSSSSALEHGFSEKEPVSSVASPSTYDSNSIPKIELVGSKDEGDECSLPDGPNDNDIEGSPVEEGKLLDYPEGGFGWLVCMASFVVNFFAFAPNMTFGIYQEEFYRTNYFPGATITAISWVGSIGTAAMFVPGPFVAPMTRFIGLRAVVALGIVMASLGLIIASFATQLWHLYLTQGFLFGFGGGIVFFSSISVTAQYFEKRRGLANGLAVAGSGIGGLAMSPLTRFLIDRLGVQWCQRIVGLAVFGFMSAIFPFIRPRIKSTKKGPIFDFSLFKLSGFRLLLITAFIVTFGYMVPVFLIPVYANKYLGEPSSTGSNLISLFSGINAVSRIILGVAADKLGRTNTLFVCCFMAGLSCIVLWSLSTNITILTVFMVFYGLFGGGFISIFPVVVAQVVGIERLTAAIGLLYFGNCFGNLLGAPIATAIMRAQGGKYSGAIIFAGLTPIIAALFVLVIRFRLNKRILAIA